MVKKLGIDIGASTVKMVLLDHDNIEKTIIRTHYGKIRNTIIEMAEELELSENLYIGVTGKNEKVLVEIFPDIQTTEEIPAITKGTSYLVPSAGSVIEIGSQSARFITNLREKVPSFSINEQCAGGTGSFFEDQMSRLGMKIEDYSDMVSSARSIPNISGRCAVFAKTDITHRQQEGYPNQDILLGLCYAVIRNYKAVIVRKLPVKKPVVLSGGVVCNQGVIRAVKEIFGLTKENLIIPEPARFTGALGAALLAENKMSMSRFKDTLRQFSNEVTVRSPLPKLSLKEGTCLTDPVCTGVIKEEGCFLGIDIGSTSTNLVIMGPDEELVDFQYLRTAGNPEKAVRTGLKNIQDRFGKVKFRAVGITGSGRERLGRMMGADVIRDEITAQAKAAVHYVEDVDTVFEIGGQDSKYISLKNGEVADFRMNKICAAGTGSFIEEQAARMEIPIGRFGEMALQSENPSVLGERCTVFIEAAITQAQSEGASDEDIAAGLCHSIVRNYLNKVVSGKKIGSKIVLQGGVDYNPGIVAAFQSAYPEQIVVSPVFPISGAYGAALLAAEEAKGGKSSFLGFDFPSVEKDTAVSTEEIQKNKMFYKKAGQLAVEDYDGRIDPSRKTIGVPLSLIMFKFFPLVNAFFKHLGFNVILSDPSGEVTIKLSQQYADGETCYPVKLIYGHMMQLAEKNVDYIFLPRVHTIRHPNSHAQHNYACPYMQVAAKVIYDTLELEKRGIRLLSPVMDLDLGAKMMASAMLETGKELGFAKAFCLPGLVKGALAVKKYSSGVEKLGRDMLSNLTPDDKVLVLITRNYGISDPVLNMGIPELLLSKGYKVLTLGHLPGMDLDISGDYPQMYWPFGDHLLSGAKLIANHPNLYAVYLTNHGCGPDSVISHMFAEEMKDKPYLQIEVDEHYSKVGVITRIEAFLNSISHKTGEKLPADFNILNVNYKKANLKYKPERDKKLLLPDVGYYTKYLKIYFEQTGIRADAMPLFDRETLALGRKETNAKEYIPLTMLAGAAVRSGEIYDREKIQLLIPLGYGADADGQYARTVRTILDRRGEENLDIISPILEETVEQYENPELLFRAVLTADILYCIPYKQRRELEPEEIPDLAGLTGLAEKAGKIKDNRRMLFASGSPLGITSLNEGVLDELSEENMVLRMPFSEMLWFLWKDNGRAVDYLEKFKNMMSQIHLALGRSSSFSDDPEQLFPAADEALKQFAGGNGRYRFAKAVEMGERADALLIFAPRYENTQMVLSLSGLKKKCRAPLLEISLDGDWDETTWSKVRSFLYYC